MLRVATVFTLVLLLCCGLIYASSRNDAFNGVSSLHGDIVAANKGTKAELDDDESCEGEEGKEECLMRRTLAAHVDYIYTQKKPRD